MEYLLEVLAGLHCFLVEYSASIESYKVLYASFSLGIVFFYAAHV